MHVMKFKYIFWLFIVLIITPNASANDWLSSSQLVTGLDALGTNSRPSVFNDSGTFKLISGEVHGVFYGFEWNGTSWVSDSSIVTGLGDIGGKSSPTIFSDLGTWKLISGSETGTLHGFHWNGTGWEINSSVVNGLGDTGTSTLPVVFNDSGTFKLISIDAINQLYGFEWNGTSWVSNSNLVDGLATTIRKADIFDDSGTWKLIAGLSNGGFNGYYWTGSTWTSDSSIINGLPLPNSGYMDTSPTVFYDFGVWKLISGLEEGTFIGYQINVAPVISNLMTESQTNPTAIRTNTSAPYFSWTHSDANSDAQSSYEIYVGTTVGTSDMWNSQVSSSNPYTTYAGTTLEEITTYYIQVRTNDGYENSDWVLGTFTLKDSTSYAPPSTSGSTSLDIYSEKISTPVIITEKITDTFAETDSLTFILYLIGSVLGALIFGIISNKENISTVILSGTVGWVVTLIAVVINNLLDLVIINSIITMLLSVFFGFIVYVIYDQYSEEPTKSKPKRRPKK